MSKKRIEQIPSQIVCKQANKLHLKKSILNTKFSWLAKYISKQNQETIEEKNYLTTSIKMYPQMRPHTKRNILKQNIQLINKSQQSVRQVRKDENKITLEHKYSSIRSRLYTENVENISKSKNGRNTSLLLSSNNPKQTFNFIENDYRRFGRNLKTDLQIYKRKHKKMVVKAENDQFTLTPWNLDEEDNKQNGFQGLRSNV